MRSSSSSSPSVMPLSDGFSYAHTQDPAATCIDPTRFAPCLVPVGRPRSVKRAVRGRARRPRTRARCGCPNSSTPTRMTRTTTTGPWRDDDGRQGCAFVMWAEALSLMRQVWVCIWLQRVCTAAPSHVVCIPSDRQESHHRTCPPPDCLKCKERRWPLTTGACHSGLQVTPRPLVTARTGRARRGGSRGVGGGAAAPRNGRLAGLCHGRVWPSERGVVTGMGLTLLIGFGLGQESPYSWKLAVFPYGPFSMPQVWFAEDRLGMPRIPFSRMRASFRWMSHSFFCAIRLLVTPPPSCLSGAGCRSRSSLRGRWL
jgi:hypothetical protein